MSNEWRYMAQRFDGSGNLGDFVDLNLPLEDVDIQEVLSGDNSMSATIRPEFSRLMGSDGRPIFDLWGACIWAESPNGEVYGGILEASNFNESNWSLECVDISGILEGTPYDGSISFVDVDPIDVFRHIWITYQQRVGGNFGVSADSTSSPIRLGLGSLVQGEDFDTGEADPEELAELAPSSYPSQEAWVDKGVKKLNRLPNGWTRPQIRTALEKWLDSGKASLSDTQKKIVAKAKKVLPNPPKRPADDPAPDPTPTLPDPDAPPPLVFQQNPYTLNWYTNQDLAADIDDLASVTPFDWHMTHRWSDEGDDADLLHHLRIGYPRLGRRLVDLRFAIGENIHQIPAVDQDGSEFANEIIVIGNGEGSAAITGRAYRPQPGKLRRTKTVVDTTITSVEGCNARAESEISARAVIDEVSELVLIEHKNAPVGSVALGDEFWLEGDAGWVELGMWVRCIGRRFSPDVSSEMYLTIVRTDRL